MKFLVKNNFNLIFFAVVISLLISVAELCTHNPVDIDGILYLHVAKTYLNQGFAAAMADYQWPFYSILIAVISRATTFSLEHVAYFLNAIFQIVIVIAFIQLIKALGGTRRQLWAAMLVILIYPFFNSIHAFISRDFAYWGLALFAILALVRYAEQLRWRDAILWGVLMSLATLFRIEGAVLLFLAPLAVLIGVKANFWQRIVYTVKIYSILLLLIFLLFIYGFYQPQHLSAHLGRVVELVTQIRYGLLAALQSIDTHAHQLAAILIPDARESAKTILIGGLLSVFLITFLKVISPLYLLLFGYGSLHNLMPASRSARVVIVVCISINLLILSVFLAQRFFLADRYLVLLALLLMLWAPFSLTKIYEDWRQREKNFNVYSWLFPGVCLVMLIMALGGVIRFGHSKSYITEAGQWIDQHTSPTIQLYSNSPQVLYYANRPHSNWQQRVSVAAPLDPIFNQSWRHYDYLALRINHPDQAQATKILTTLKLQPIKIFKNKRGDEVMIFEVKK